MSNGVEVSTDKSLLNVSLIHDFISNKSYWGQGRSLEQVRTTIENSVCFGIYSGREQLGFCRVVTDKVAFAYVMDFFIIESFQGKGLGQLLVEEMLAHPELQSVSWLLATDSAHEFYGSYGFAKIDDPERYMKRIGAALG